MVYSLLQVVLRIYIKTSYFGIRELKEVRFEGTPRFLKEFL